MSTQTPQRSETTRSQRILKGLFLCLLGACIGSPHTITAAPPNTPAIEAKAKAESTSKEEPLEDLLKPARWPNKYIEGQEPRIYFGGGSRVLKFTASEEISPDYMALCATLMPRKQGFVEENAELDAVKLLKEHLHTSKFNHRLVWKNYQKAYEAHTNGDEVLAGRLEKKAREYRQISAQEKYNAFSLIHKLVQVNSISLEPDQLYFLTAYLLKNMGENMDALLIYDSFSWKYPDSKLVPSTLISVADHKFENGHIDSAFLKYKKAIMRDASDDDVGYAMYKMAWCHLKLGETPKALEQFHAVIKYQKSSNAYLQTAAILDLSRAYFSLKKDPRDAPKYFKAIIKDPVVFDERINTLAEQYLAQGDFEDGISIYEELVKLNEKSPEQVLYKIKIMFAVEAFAEPDKTVRAITETVQLYSALKKNIPLTNDSPRALLRADNILERHVRDMAKWYHRVALKMNNSQYLKRSKILCQTYIDHFGGEEGNVDTVNFCAGVLSQEEIHTNADVGE